MSETDFEEGVVAQGKISRRRTTHTSSDSSRLEFGEDDVVRFRWNVISTGKAGILERTDPRQQRQASSADPEPRFLQRHPLNFDFALNLPYLRSTTSLPPEHKRKRDLEVRSDFKTVRFTFVLEARPHDTSRTELDSARGTSIVERPLKKRGRDPRRTRQSNATPEIQIWTSPIVNSRMNMNEGRNFKRTRRQQCDATTQTPDCFDFITRANPALGLTGLDSFPRKRRDKANDREKRRTLHY
ncbi:hypothetical protein BDZ89DRAFT_1243819 [Hymenopellis radicata]|nr:hypothetical protein BDZ89DRAFT_1243819 [Hymenopellis radicata]